MIVALLGAESTGKSTLSHALAHHLRAALAHAGAATAAPVVVVDEGLRTWCQTHGRVPQPHEQAPLAWAQDDRIRQAQQQAGPTGWVVADTASVMTAAYSDHYFGGAPWFDRPAAGRTPLVADIHLLMGLDLPWQADGPWRDGPAVQAAVDDRLRQRLQASGTRYLAVYGQGPARTAAALGALAGVAPDPALKEALKKEAINLYPPCANGQKILKNGWACETCSDPACERRLFTRLMDTPDR